MLLLVSDDEVGPRGCCCGDEERQRSRPLGESYTNFERWLASRGLGTIAARHTMPQALPLAMLERESVVFTGTCTVTSAPVSHSQKSDKALPTAHRRHMTSQHHSHLRY